METIYYYSPHILFDNQTKMIKFLINNNWYPSTRILHVKGNQLLEQYVII